MNLVEKVKAISAVKATLTLFAVAALAFPGGAYAQKASLKTNLLYDATANANLGVEVSLAPKWTLDVSGNYNGWTFDNNKKWKHWLVQPEARYWFCDKMMGHFIGLHTLGGQYNIGGFKTNVHFLGTDWRKFRDSRFEGWMAGVGIAYGYSWTLARHWNLEAEIGVGYVYSRYDRFKCIECGDKIESGKHHNYFGPTKAALNLVYVF